MPRDGGDHTFMWSHIPVPPIMAAPKPISSPLHVPLGPHFFGITAIVLILVVENGQIENKVILFTPAPPPAPLLRRHQYIRMQGHAFCHDAVARPIK